jgi:hypothetical protein
VDLRLTGLGLLVLRNIEQWPQTIDRAALFRLGQWPHVRGAAEPDSRPINDAPAGLVDLNRAPLGIAEVEIDLAVKLADPDEHLPHQRVVLRLRLDDAERRRYRFAVRRPAGLLEETPLQPAPEAP